MSFEQKMRCLKRKMCCSKWKKASFERKPHCSNDKCIVQNKKHAIWNDKCIIQSKKMHCLKENCAVQTTNAPFKMTNVPFKMKNAPTCILIHTHMATHTCMDMCCMVLEEQDWVEDCCPHMVVPVWCHWCVDKWCRWYWAVLELEYVKSWATWLWCYSW